MKAMIIFRFSNPGAAARFVDLCKYQVSTTRDSGNPEEVAVTYQDTTLDHTRTLVESWAVEIGGEQNRRPSRSGT